MGPHEMRSLPPSRSLFTIPRKLREHTMNTQRESPPEKVNIRVRREWLPVPTPPDAREPFWSYRGAAVADGGWRSQKVGRRRK